MDKELHLFTSSVKKLFDRGDVVLFRWNNDASWSIDYVSQNVTKLLGYSYEEFMNGDVSYASCIHYDYLPQLKREVSEAIENKRDFFQHEPYKIVTKEHQERWVLDQTVIERDEQGNVLSFIGYINDITKTMQLSEENRLLNERFELAIAGSSDGIWDWDITTDVSYFSPTWKSMLGYSEHEIKNRGSAFFDLIHPEDKQKAQDALKKHFKDPLNPYAIELRLRKSDGNYKWILSRGKALFDSEGKPLRMLGSHVDISQQKKTQEQLAASELRWKFAIEGSGDGLWDWNLQDDSVFFSNTWKEMLGFSKDEIGNTLDEWSSRVRPEHLAKVYHDIQEYLDGNTTRYVNEHQVVCKDGSYKWILDRGVIVERDAAGKPLRMIGTHTDIDAKKTAQERINAANRLFSDMFKNHKAIMLLVNPKDGGIVDANKSAQEFYGYTHKEFIALNINELNTASPQEVQERVNEAAQNRSKRFTFEHRKKSGELVTIETNTSLIETETQELLFSIITDVTQEKKQEKRLKTLFKQLQSAQKIAKLGIWELDHKTGKLDWSDEIYTIFGIDKNHFQPSYESFLTAIHPDDRKSVTEAFEQSLQDKKPYEITHRLLMPNSEIKYVLEQCTTKFDKDANPLVSKGTVQDITELEHLDIEMRRERERLKALMDNSSEGIFIINKNFQLVDCNKMAQTLLGYTREEMLQMHILDWDVNLSVEVLANLVSSLSHKTTVFETIHKRKDGSLYTASISSVLITLSQEEFIYASVRDITELKKLQDEILHEKNFIDTIIESSNAVVAVIDATGTMIKMNTYAQEFTGYTQEEISQEPYKWKCFLPQDMQAKVVGIVENARRGNIIKSFQNSWISRSGESRMFEWSNTLVKKDDGSMDYIATIGIDITQQQEHKAFLELLINAQSHMVILSGDDALKYVNRAVLEFFGFDSLELLKENISCMCERFLKNDYSFYPNKEEQGPAWILAINKLPAEQQIVTMESYKNAEPRSFQVRVERYDTSPIFVVSFVDITENIAKQHVLEYKSTHDPLTKTYNRSYLYENWKSLLSSHKQSGLLSVIAIIDIDYFKNVNDTYGHEVGDDVLCSLVTNIQQNSRSSDTLIRWGGEEFILIAPVRKKEHVIKLLEKLRLGVSETKSVKDISITISIGAAVYEDHEGSSLEEIISIADEQLYISKSAGRNRVSLT